MHVSCSVEESKRSAARAGDEVKGTLEHSKDAAVAKAQGAKGSVEEAGRAGREKASHYGEAFRSACVGP